MNTIEAQMNVNRILSFAMMTSGLLYVLVLYMIPFEGEVGEDVRLYTMLFPALALGAAVGSFVMPRLMSGAGVHASAGAQVEIDHVIQQYRVKMLVSLAMSEAVIIFGVVVAFLTQTPEWVLPYLLVGEVLMIVRFPRTSHILDQLSPQTRAALGER